MITDNQYGWLS